MWQVGIMALQLGSATPDQVIWRPTYQVDEAFGEWRLTERIYELSSLRSYCDKPRTEFFTLDAMSADHTLRWRVEAGGAGLKLWVTMYDEQGKERTSFGDLRSGRAIESEAGWIVNKFRELTGQLVSKGMSTGQLDNTKAAEYLAYASGTHLGTEEGLKRFIHDADEKLPRFREPISPFPGCVY